MTVIREASAWLFGGAQRGRVGPLLVLAVGAAASALVSTAALRRYTYEGVRGADRTDRRRRFSLDIEGRGGLSSLVLLEGTLIFRNREPREQLLLGGGALVFFAYLIVRGALPVFSLGMASFMLGLLLPVTYGQFAFAWHGKHFDGLLVRALPGRLVRATLVVLMALLGVPPGLLASLGGIPVLLSGVAALGGLGLVTVSLWLPRLETALRHRRRAMLRGFRGEWLSPCEWHW